MNFLAPAALAFAATLPVVVLFYLLKRKRVVRVVPSTLLWQRFLAETQASAPLQRLRNNWLLWFQLLLLALMVLALARPYFIGKAGEAALQVVILDASASMQATDVSPSRFEVARAGALKLVDGLKSGFGDRSQQMLIMVAGANAEVRQSASSEKAALRRALSEAKVTDSTTRLAEALRVAETLTRERSDAEVHLFSDGAGVDLSEFAAKDLRLIFHRLGERAENAGIVTMDVRANPENPAQRAVFAGIANYSTQPREVRIELLFDGELRETRALTLAPTNTTPIALVASQERDGVFSLRLSGKDDLPADDEARLVSLLPQPIRVLLVTQGNRFLEKAIKAAAPNLELAVVSDYADASVKADVFVLDDVTPTVWPAGNVLAVNVAATNWFEAPVGRLEGPPIVDWRNTHGLLRFVSFDNVQIAEAMGVKLPSWGVSLVDSPQSPLVVAGELGRQRVVWVGFDVLQSTWPLRISFPIFVANAIDWLNPATAKAELFSLSAGEAIRLPLGDFAGAGVVSAKVTRPDGTVRVIPLDATARELVFGETARQGLYQVVLGTNTLTFAANLLDAQESNVRPQDTLQVGKYTEVVATSQKRADLEYWRWFALGALAVMMVEWWWFHRRTA